MADEVRKLIDIEMETPEHVTGCEKIFFRVDNKTSKIIKRVMDSLLISRGIPTNIDALNIGDPLALYFNQTMTHLDSNTAVERAKEVYRGYQKDTQEHAFYLAITSDTTFTNPPRPYTDKDKEDAEDDLPDWVEETPNIPDMHYDLGNKYEARFKQLIDTLDDAGLIFQAQFRVHINNSIGTALREIVKDGMGDKDPDGFQSESTSGQVSNPPVPDSGNGAIRRGRNANKNKSTNDTALRKADVITFPT